MLALPNRLVDSARTSLESSQYRFGGLDVLLNNAGYGLAGSLETDFVGRSLELMQKSGLDAYDASIQRVMAVFASPDRAGGYSEAAEIADAIYIAATDGTNRLRYLVDRDAELMASDRAKLSDEAYLEWAVAHFNL